MSESEITFTVKRRPWWVWLIGLILLPIEIFFLQSGFASFGEGQPTAAWASLVVAVLLAVAYWAFARNRTA